MGRHKVSQVSSAITLTSNSYRFEPPAQSKPEAANFPSEQYTFSESHELFKAPAAYAEPPKDMWYKVPENKPNPTEKPKPIFPWEQHSNRPVATRVFAEDLPASPTPAPAMSTPTHPFSTVHYEDTRTVPENRIPSPERASPPKTADEQWQAFQQSNVNAWDTVPGIENYVRTIVESRDGKKGKTQTLKQATGTQDLDSPLLERRNRRESLIITDFPSAVERPSLPVTPAAIRRPTFWGDERDEAGELPAAEGVPPQAEWVCPQCGFSSVNASDFERRRSSLASATTAVVTPAPSAASAILPSSSPEQQSLSIEKADVPEDEAVDDESTLVEQIVEKTTQSLQPSYAARSGLSPSGVPLASLTDPKLLTSGTQLAAFDFHKHSTFETRAMSFSM